ncbi:MAG: pyridoxal phosphate-dependent aminotransferase [Spirochaetaceae bacterium]|jgi:aspartate aminotransferase|nr:pyridoxal phosphate-dependent aminotransferase [Spirochaetaceae bacterium]
MPAAKGIVASLASSSMIRKMFEEGLSLKRQYGAENVFDFSLGNPDVDPPESFFSALEALVKERKSGAHGYMPNAGFPDVREALARKIGAEQGVSLTANDVIMAVGAAGALNVTLKAILNPGDEVVVVRPFFMEYRAYTANHGGKLVEAAAAPDFNLDIDAISAALTAETAAVIINSPNNPTGRVYNAQTQEALAAVLLRHGKNCGRFPYLIADEPYRELVYDGLTAPPVLSVYPHSIVVSSFSKNLSLPGERIGYIAVAPAADDKENLTAALIYATRTLGFVNAPALMQRAVAALTAERAPVEIYAARRQAFMEILDEAGIRCIKPEGAFYIFAKAPDGDDEAFCSLLKKHLILAVPGTAFGAAGYARFAYCVNERVIRASLKAFKAAMSAAD